jgi:apolipoprotein N-acyltransferase
VRTVRVAAIGWPEGFLELKQLLRAFATDLKSDERDGLLAAFTRVNEHFMVRTADAARAGARIVVWPEANCMVLRAEEEALRARLQDLARTHQLYLCVGFAVLDTLPIGKFQNKAVLFTPEGGIAASYIKTKQVPGLETRYSVPGSGQMPVVETPFGRLSLAICYDLDFPWHLRQAGRQQVDLLLAPASDWREIGELHHTSAVFRAVENGMAMVRAARWGWSAAVSATGHDVAVSAHYTAQDRILLTELPCAGQRTLYSRIGDSFAWLCLAALAGLTAWAVLVGNAFM